jgi:hypothetical protein
MKDLQDDDIIIILPADKGRLTVIMNKSDYTDRVINHLTVTLVRQQLIILNKNLNVSKIMTN